LVVLTVAKFLLKKSCPLWAAFLLTLINAPVQNFFCCINLMQLYLKDDKLKMNKYEKACFTYPPENGLQP
jgi:hypothetical protein